MTAQQEPKASDFHYDTIIIDTHVDTILRQLDLGHDLALPNSDGYMDLPGMKKGNLTAAFLRPASTTTTSNAERPGLGNSRSLRPY